MLNIRDYIFVCKDIDNYTNIIPSLFNKEKIEYGKRYIIIDFETLLGRKNDDILKIYNIKALDEGEDFNSETHIADISRDVFEKCFETLRIHRIKNYLKYE